VWSTVSDPRTPLFFTPKALITVTPDQSNGGSLALYLDVVALH